MKLLSVIDKWRLRSRDQDMVGTFATVWLGLIRQSLVLLDSEPLINVQKKILSCVHLDRHGSVVGSPCLLIDVGGKMRQIYTATSKSVRNSIGKIDFSFFGNDWQILWLVSNTSVESRSSLQKRKTKLEEQSATNRKGEDFQASKNKTSESSGAVNFSCRSLLRMPNQTNYSASSIAS